MYRNRLAAQIFLLCLALLALAGVLPAAAQAPLPVATPDIGVPFVEEFDYYDPARWTKANGWANPMPPFWCGWRDDHTELDPLPHWYPSTVLMRIRLDDIPCPEWCSGRPWASDELRSNHFYGYGTYRVRLRAARGSGLVTAFFIYTGPYDGNPHHELTLEVLGRDPATIWITTFAGDDVGRSVSIPLGFDAADAFNTYRIDWSQDAVRVFANGRLLYTDDGSNGPLPSVPGRLMMSLWPCTGRTSWCGDFIYPGEPIYADFDFASYSDRAPQSSYLPLVLSRLDTIKALP